MYPGAFPILSVLKCTKFYSRTSKANHKMRDKIAPQTNDILIDMMVTPNLTLGLLVFNQAPYIRELLESICNQSDLAFEMVIIDNGSTDDSLDEIQTFLAKSNLDKQVKVISNINNTGSAAGLRQLLEVSDTRFLAVIHGDDILAKNYVAIVRREIESHSRTEAFNLTLAAFGNDSSVVVPKTIYQPIWTKFGFYNSLLVSGLNPGVMPGSVLNREFVLSNHLLDFDEAINGVEDTLLWMRIIRSGGHINSVKNIVYNYRIHKSQFSYDEEKNSYFYGFARRRNILEARNFLERTLSYAEIGYELRRFSTSSRYAEGLGDDLLRKKNLFKFLRPVNTILRRIAVRIAG
jgi:glycosyltransferase involved in cell wall biosynthesis